MGEIGRREIKALILAHRDCLTRFGFEWFEHDVGVNGCEVLVLNQQRLSPEQKMVQAMTIVHCSLIKAVRSEELSKKVE